MMEDTSAMAANGTELGPKGQRQRKIIIGICMDILDESGLDGVVMRQVAARAEMKLGNLQYYFSTKDDLLEGVLRDIFLGDEQIVLAGYEDGDIETVFRKLIEVWETDMARIYMTIFEATGRVSRFRKIKREVYSEFYELLAGLLRVVKPRAKHDELIHKAKLITAVLDGASLQLHDEKPAIAAKQRAKFHDGIVQSLLAVVES